MISDLVALEVLLYWQERTGTTVKSEKVKRAILDRITRRLDDGFGPDDLKKCVDFALCDEFYAEKGYYKQPDVIFRNAERVQSIVSRYQHVAARPLPL